jgi:hypothetical protein
MLRITIVQHCGSARMVRNVNCGKGRFQAARREVFDINHGKKETFSDRLKGL